MTRFVFGAQDGNRNVILETVTQQGARYLYKKFSSAIDLGKEYG